MPINQLERPYRLTQHDQPISDDWPLAQRELWQTRLAVITENPHIARVEQPAYKRRWDETVRR